MKWLKVNQLEVDNSIKKYFFSYIDRSVKITYLFKGRSGGYEKE